MQIPVQPTLPLSPTSTLEVTMSNRRIKIATISTIVGLIFAPFSGLSFLAERDQYFTGAMNEINFWFMAISMTIATIAFIISAHHGPPWETNQDHNPHS